jgi:hypothetical protein
MRRDCARAVRGVRVSATSAERNFDAGDVTVARFATSVGTTPVPHTFQTTDANHSVVERPQRDRP